MPLRGASTAWAALRGWLWDRLPRLRRLGLLAAAAAPFALPGEAPDSPVPSPAAGEAPPPAPAAQIRENPPYEGRFVFTRIRYGPMLGRGGFRMRGGAWSHDYPYADENLSRLLHEYTTVRPELSGTNVFDLDDPELFRHPIAYISEPGFWTMDEAEARALREYVLKGGFLIFDDFEHRQLDNLEAQLRRVLPEYRPVEIDETHPIFRTFFNVREIYHPHPLVDVVPNYYGLFEDGDPSRRMVAIINHNNDLAEYWEWSAQGRFAADPTNEAFRIGINYIVWGLTH